MYPGRTFLPEEVSKWARTCDPRRRGHRGVRGSDPQGPAGQERERVVRDVSQDVRCRCYRTPPGSMASARSALAGAESDY
jgi:hypothetical protein